MDSIITIKYTCESFFKHRHDFKGCSIFKCINLVCSTRLCALHSKYSSSLREFRKPKYDNFLHTFIDAYNSYLYLLSVNFLMDPADVAFSLMIVERIIEARNTYTLRLRFTRRGITYPYHQTMKMYKLEVSQNDYEALGVEDQDQEEEPLADQRV